MRLLRILLVALLALGQAGPSGAVSSVFRTVLLLNGGCFGGATIDLNFAAGTTCGTSFAALTVSRASVAYEDDLSGNWSPFAANTLRRTNKGALIEETRTNSIRNNSMQGAVVGSPGTLPTNWNISGANGLTFTVTALPTTNGVECVRIRITGTPTAAATTSALNFEAATQIAAVNGQVWTHGFFAAIVSGTQTNISSLGMVARLRDSGGTSLSAGTSVSITSATSALSRFSVTQTLSNASVAFLQPALNLVNTDNTTPIDITIDIGWPQLELGAFATSPIRTTGASATRAADAVSFTPPSGMVTRASVFVQVNTAFQTAATFRQPWQIDDGSNANAILLDQTNATTVRTESNSASAGTNRASATITSGARNKIATAWQDSDWATSANGGAVGTNAVSGLPTLTGTTFRIGSGPGSTTFFCNYVERIALWPNTRLPNATLQALTQ